MTALKTTSLRIRGAKAELESLGEETDGMCESTSKLRDEIMRLSGVDIMKNDNTFKSTYDILLEISEVWDSLTDVSQAALLEDIAGKRNASVIKSVITNVDDLKGAYADAQNSAGIAMEANDTYLDSIEGKMGKMSASFEQLSNEILNSGVVKFIVDLAGGFVKLNSSIAETTGALGLIASYVGFIKLIKDFRALGESAISAQAAINNISTSLNGAGGFNANQIASELAVLNKAQQRAVLWSSKLTKEQKEAVRVSLEQVKSGKLVYGSQIKEALATEALTAEEKNAIAASIAGEGAKLSELEASELYNKQQLVEIIQTSSLSEAKQAELISRLSNTGAIESENAALSTQLALMATNPMTWIMTALALLPMLVTWITDAYESTDELHERVEQLKSDYNQLAEENKKNIQTLTITNSDGKSLLEEFEELSRGVDGYGNKISLTNEQYNRYKEICDSIVDVNPSIAEGYNSNAEAIGNNVSILKELIKTQKNEAKQNAIKTTTGENWNDRVEDAINEYDKATERSGYDNKSAWARLTAGSHKYADMADIGDVKEFMRQALQIGVADFDMPDQDYFEKYYSALKDNWDENLQKWKEYVNDKSSNPTAIHADGNGKWSEKDISEYEGYLSELVNSYEGAQQEIEKSSKGLIDSYKIVAQATDGYEDLTVGAQKYINNWISNDAMFKVDENTTEDTVAKAKAAIQDMVDKIANSDYVARFSDGSAAIGQGIFDKLFSTDSKNIPYKEYEEQIKDALSELYKAINVDENGNHISGSDKQIIDLGITLGFNFDTKDENSIDNKINEVSRIIQNRVKAGTFSIPAEFDTSSIKEKLEGLSADQLNNLFTIDINSINSWNMLLASMGDADAKTKQAKISEDAYIEALKEFENNPTAETYSLMTEAAKIYYQSASMSTDELKTKYEELSGSIDKIQSAYKSVYTAISDYNSSGVLTIDNLQSILELDEEYVNLMIDENGALNLNSDAFTDLTKAQLENLKVQQAMQIIDSVSNLKGQALAAYEASNAYIKAGQSAEEYAMGMIQGKLADGSMTKKQADIAMKSIANRFALIDSVSDSLDKNSQVAMGAASATDELNKSTTESKQALEAQEKALEKQKDALEAEKKALENSQKALENQKEDINTLKDEYKELYDSVDSVIDIAKKYIQQQKNDEKQAYEDKKKSLDDIIDKKKKELDIDKDNLEFQKKLNEYNKSIVQNQLKVAASSLDKTSSGRSANRMASADLKKSKKDLSEYLQEHSIESRKDALTLEKERIDQSYEKKIKAVERYLKNEKKLNKDAQDLIGNYSKESYRKLKQYTIDYTDKTGAEFDRMWTKAKNANRKYNTVGGTTKTLLSALKNRIYGCEDKVKDLDKQITKIKRQIDDKKNGIDAVSTKISGVKDKISAISSATKSVKNSIANNVVKPTAEALKKADALLKRWQKINKETKNDKDNTNTKEHGWMYQFGSKVYKISGVNMGVAIRSIISAISKDYDGGVNLSYSVVKKRLKRYASGTRNSSGITSITDENGYEFKMPKLSNGRYTIMPEGSQVFTKEMTDSLWSFSNNPMEFLRKEFTSSQNTNNSINNSKSVSISMPISIAGDATQSTVNALRAQADSIVNTAVNKVYKEILGIKQ